MVAEQEATIGEQRERATKGLSVRERTTTIGLGGASLLAAAVFAVVGPWQTQLSVVVLLALVGAYAAAATVQFEVGTGLAIPTQVVLVPMFFCLPLAIVPLVVLLGLVLASVIDCLRGRIPLDRALAPLASGWHVLGPALVLAAFGADPPSWSNWPIYLAALGAQFLLDASSAALGDRIALGPLQPGYFGAFAWVFLIDLCLAPLGLALAMASAADHYSFLAAVPIVVLLRVFAGERRARIDHALELSSAYRGTALLLGDVIEADDAYTGSHSRDVVELTLAVADKLGLDATVRRRAEFTALLHDVGKIRIPQAIVNKTGPLDAEETAVMRTHTIEGEHMLLGVGGALGEIGRLVRSCHERWDGKGYPDGLLTEETPLVSRIVCACDAYNAMTTNRSYRAALDPESARRELRSNAGTQFDPTVVAALLQVVATPNPVTARVELLAA